MKFKVISYAITFIAGCAITAGIFFFNKQEPETKIGKETKTKTEFIRIPGSPEEYITAFNSKFEITGKIIKGNWFHVSVDDGYKRGEKDFQLQTRDIRKHIIQIGYSFFVADKQIFSSAEFAYLRSWESFAIGGGPIINTWSQHRVYGIKFLTQYKF